MRPGAHPVQRRTSILLESCGVSHVTSGAGLSDLCPRLQELHLARNALQWTDVSTVFTALPQLTFLDLAQNPLLPPCPSPPSSLSPSLHTLVLNSTHLPWPAVQVCLEASPSLQTLHLTSNGYSEVSLDPGFSHGSLQRLHINNNVIIEWAELEKLGHAFPALQTLIAMANPLGDIREVRPVFPSLCCLTLNSTKLSEWQSIEALAALPDLRDLSLLGIPLGQAMKKEERRFAVIVRMPSLSKLNKSEITPTERESAERWAIRHYRGKREQPSTYQQLVEIHGDLKPLVDLNFDPHPYDQATIQFDIEHSEWKRSETHTLDLHQTIGQLKRWLAKQLDVSQSTFRLYYEDSDFKGTALSTNELRSRGKKLHAYKMKDGDRIYVQLL